MSSNTYSQLVTAISNIVASSDANDGDSLANAILAARKLVPEQDSPYPAELARADRLLSAEELRRKYVTEHPQHKCDAWLAANPNAGSDSLYWQWVESQIEQEEN